MPLTLVTLHAHPDDESIATAGTMMKAKADGHRVVLVIATRGELGETPGAPDFAGVLADRRVEETMASAAILGVDRVEFLGYHDSGMAGEETNSHAHAFAAADLDEAAERLAKILREEHADVLTVYDDNGQYGHPDHIQVHRVGYRAAELAGTPTVYEATVNRDHLIALMRANPEVMESEEAPEEDFLDTLGKPEAEITTFVDAREYAERKRDSMRAHASQIPADSFFLQMPEEAFRESFGWEWFIRRGLPPGTREDGIFGN